MQRDDIYAKPAAPASEFEEEPTYRNLITQELHLVPELTLNSRVGLSNTYSLAVYLVPELAPGEKVTFLHFYVVKLFIFVHI